MDDFQSAEETAFVVDEVSNVIKESIEGAIGGNAYQHNKVNQWTSSVVEQCLNQLTKLGKPFNQQQEANDRRAITNDLSDPNACALYCIILDM
eukprot:gene17510-9130_t